MAFVPPIVFTDGTQLLAASLASSFEAVRKYINVDIVEGDLQVSNFGLSDLQEGEAFGVTPDFIMMTGDQYSHYYAKHASVPQERHYHTSTVKRYKPMETVRWQSIPDLAKQWYMEDSGNALIEISFFASEDENDDCRGAVFPWIPVPGAGNTRSVGQNSNFQLVVDGVLSTADDETIAYAFAESGSTTATFGNFSIMDNRTGYQGSVTGMRKYITILYLAKNLSQGWHQISVVCDAKNEKGFISMRNLNIETFYTMGYAPVSKNSIATNRKLPETIF
jgi:hypothetical protein